MDESLGSVSGFDKIVLLVAVVILFVCFRSRSKSFCCIPSLSVDVFEVISCDLSDNFHCLTSGFCGHVASVDEVN